MKLLSHYTLHQRKMYPEIINWENHIIGDRLSYSYRDTEYDRRTYPSNLHYHDYYELVVLEEGDIQYVCDGQIYDTQYGDVIVIPPGRFHMSAINCERTRYKRHVFYLYPSAFDAIGHSALAAFLYKIEGGEALTFSSPEQRHELMRNLAALRETYEKALSALDEALVLSYVIQIFYLLNQESWQVKGCSAALPDNIGKLQQYIDKNFSEISSVSQVAEHFFYSREYVSRLFRKYFDTTISEYITKQRIAKSQALIVQDTPLIDIAYQVGFGSLSAFIRAFRAVTGMTPSEYRKLIREAASGNDMLR